MNSEELELVREPAAEPAPQARVLDLKVTFKPEGVEIDLKSNLSPLEQLGAIDIFRQHVLSSAIGSGQS